MKRDDKQENRVRSVIYGGKEIKKKNIFRFLPLFFFFQKK